MKPLTLQQVLLIGFTDSTNGVNAFGTDTIHALVYDLSTQTGIVVNTTDDRSTGTMQFSHPWLVGKSQTNLVCWVYFKNATSGEVSDAVAIGI